MWRHHIKWNESPSVHCVSAPLIFFAIWRFWSSGSPNASRIAEIRHRSVHCHSDESSDEQAFSAAWRKLWTFLSLTTKFSTSVYFRSILVYFRRISGETHAFSFSSIFSIDQSSFRCPIEEIWKSKNFTIDYFFWFVNIIFVYCRRCHSQTCLISTFRTGYFIIMFCIWPCDGCSWLETWTLNLNLKFLRKVNS